MLIYFTIGNYKSIKEPLTLNFTASAISEHIETNIIHENKSEILKTILLYGHNASGKSKILDAFIFFKLFITQSATTNQGDELIGVEPFRLSEETEKKPSHFEACFFLDGIKYRYGFEADRQTVYKEWLLQAKAKKEYPVFLRIEQKFEIDFKRFENAEGLENRTRSNALFLSVASQWNVTNAEIINKYFRSIFAVSGLKDSKYLKNLTIKMLQDSKMTRLVHQFIKKADLGIVGIEVTELPIAPPLQMDQIDENVRVSIFKILRDEAKSVITFHKKYNAKKEVVGTETFLLDKDESEGTKKYFGLIGLILTALSENRLIVMDEFDARLHTLLSKAILKLFNSAKIKSKGQLLVASHDTALLDKNILRRDQIYFVEKNQFGATSTTSLVEFKARKESPFDRNYLEGKYGAIPFIDDLETLVANG